MIDAQALGTLVVFRFMPTKLDPVPAFELLCLIERPERNRVKPEPSPAIVNAGSANRFTVFFADMRRGLDENDGFGGSVKIGHDQDDPKVRPRFDGRACDGRSGA